MHTRRTRSSSLRAALVAAASLVLAAALAGCGGSNSSDAGSADAGGLDQVSITGKVGTAPQIHFDGKVTDPDTTTKTLVKGTGATLKQGDTVIAQIVAADGTTEKVVSNSYESFQPQVVSVDSTQLNKIYFKAISGQAIGSRVVVSTSAATLFGSTSSLPSGIGAKDVLLIVVDLVAAPQEKPDGAQHAAPSWAPTLQLSKGVPTGFSFKGTPKPDGKLRKAVLYAGTGAKVKQGQAIVVRYLGEVYGGSKPFDQNFTTTPTSFQIGVGKVITGWDKTLVGSRVGSRVLLAIPPKDGYGKTGQSSAGIKGTDTLYFVVDVVGVG